MGRFLVISMAIFVLACGDKDKKGPDEADAFGLNILQGRWQSTCTPNISPFPDARGITMSTKFTGSRMELTYNLFENENCTSPNIRILRLGRYYAKPTEATGLFHLDENVASWVIEPLSYVAAVKLNNISYCGLTNWQDGRARVVTRRNCDGSARYKNAPVYNIMFVNEDATEITFGLITNDRNGSATTRRPDRLSPFHVFRKLP